MFQEENRVTLIETFILKKDSETGRYGIINQIYEEIK